MAGEFLDIAQAAAGLRDLPSGAANYRLMPCPKITMYGQVTYLIGAGNMASSHLRLVPPKPENGQVRRSPPVRTKDTRTRKHLTPAEVERLIAGARDGRHGFRDSVMILVAYRHGLRASELVDLRWDQVDFAAGTLHVRRLKNGTASTHPLLGDEMRALRRLQRETDDSPFIFVTERGAPFTVKGFSHVVARAGEAAGLSIKPHPHMLRHGCGYALAAKGHDTRSLQAYLGHRNIQNTTVYTELSPTRFKDFWRK